MPATPSHSALLTDSYQLTMMQGYLDHQMTQEAVFELFVRRLPPNRAFLVAAGLEQALEYLEQVSFSAEEITWLGKTYLFTPQVLSYLSKFRFTGHVDALPEGTIFFPNEPILRIQAPLPEAQLIESRLINIIHFQTMIASKAVRSVLSAAGKTLVDFGFRRAHGAEAGLLAARAAYLCGFDGTSAVQAGHSFEIPVYGTMAHSYVQAHIDEGLAFENFAKSHKGNIVLLIDTYDTRLATQKVIQLAQRLNRSGIKIDGVRLDSGDLLAHSKAVRNILDQAGLKEIKIFASGNLDEYSITHLLSSGAPIDAFGVGTHLTTSADASSLDCVYKLQEYAGQPRKKRSEGKSTWPGRKQVFRIKDPIGKYAKDKIVLENEKEAGDALLKPVMRSGKKLDSDPKLTSIREQFISELKNLPDSLKSLKGNATYPVEVSIELQKLSKQIDRKS